MKARRTVQEAIHADDEQLDQTEIVKLLEEEMLEAAQNLEFERAAQLRDKLNEMKGAPTIKSGSRLRRRDADDGEAEQRKIWQPKSKGGGRRPREYSRIMPLREHGRSASCRSVRMPSLRPLP